MADDPTTDAAIQMAETLQTAHINRHPDPDHDRAPETSMDKKQRVDITTSLPDEDELSDLDDASEDEIPVSILRPTPRRPQMPPLPDMRFEQSYLASIKDCAGWQGVAYVTVRDQVMMPFLQGTVWALIVAGWRHWNGAASFKGRSIGSRIRRWWWGVNNWEIPKTETAAVREGLTDSGKIADFYEGEANAGGD